MRRGTVILLMLALAGVATAATVDLGVTTKIKSARERVRPGPNFIMSVDANRPTTGFTDELWFSYDTTAWWVGTGSGWTQIFPGLGPTPYTTGGIHVATSTIATAWLADVATGNVLLSGGVGVLPAYGQVGLTTHVTGVLPVANGGTNTSTSFTTGSVPFSVSGTYTQNNSKLFWDNTNFRLGVGTATPGDFNPVTADGDAIGHFRKDQDANTIFATENASSTGVSAAAVIRTISDTAVQNFTSHGSARTTTRFGVTIASYNELLSVLGNGMLFGTNTSVPLILGTNALDRIHIEGGGNVGIGTAAPVTDAKLQVAGHIHSTGTTPTMGACGTSPAIVGTDQGGKVTVGSGATTSCQVNFGTTWATAPICVANGSVASPVSVSATSTTAVTIITGLDFQSSTIFYVCIGRG